jgi:hypothetical protein
MILNEVLEQFGQPCSYCFAINAILTNEERLSLEDAREYSRHILSYHRLKPFEISP